MVESKRRISRIMLASHASNLNGAELCFIETIKGLHIAFPGIKIFCVFPKDGPLIGLCKTYIDSYEIIDLPWWIEEKKKRVPGEKIWNLKRVYYSVIELKKYIKVIQPDLVISNTIVAVTPSIAARLSGIEHVWYIHELGKEDHDYRFMFGENITKRIIGVVSRLVLVNSLFVYSRYKNQINSGKLKTIYQPVTITNYRIAQHKKSNDMVVLMVGRFAPGKGQIEAIEALRRLIKRGEEINLILVGATHGEYSQTVREYIKKHDLDSRISVVDFTPGPVVYYEMADIALICSRNEAFGRVTIEAMKYGLPIIASKAGANTELIDDGVTGIFYESGNIEDLMAKILKLKDIELREKIRSNALKWANGKFNLEQYAKDLRYLILACLK